MMADDYNLDLNDIINEKLKKNQIKYPKNKKVDLTKKQVKNIKTYLLIYDA